MRRYVLLLLASILIPAGTLAQGSEDLSAAWDGDVAESTATQLSDALLRTSDSAHAADARFDLRAEQLRNTLVALAVDTDQLSSELSAGKDRDQTEALFRKLETRLMVLLRASVGDSVELSQREVEEALRLWNELAAQYRRR